MPRFQDIITDNDLNGLPGAIVTVRDYPSGNLSTLTADSGGSLTNPLTADANGAYYFNAANAIYSLEFRLLAYEPAREVRLVNLGNLVDSVTLAASTGAGLIGFIENGTGAVARTMQSKVRDLSLSPMDYGAIGGGSTDDTAAVLACCNYAFANGFTVDGQGRTFGVTGGLRFDNLPSANMRNIEFLQLSPNGTVGGVPTTDRRTLFFNNCNKVRLQNVRVNRGTDKTSGSLSSAAGIYIEGGAKHFLLDVRVHGDGQGSGVVLDGCADSVTINVVGHDMAYDSPSATDDLIMGVWYNACTDCTFISSKGYNLTGNATGYLANTFTRGIAVSGCVNCSFIAPKAYNVDQCMDVTGEPAANAKIQISDVDFHDGGIWGLKIANTGFVVSVSGGTISDCGLSGVVISGPTGTGDAAKGEHILVDGVIVRNTGSNGTTRGAHIGFRIMPGGSGDGTGYPRGVKFTNCHAIDDQTTPTMTTGFSNEVAYDASKRFNQIINCRSIGHITSAQSGFEFIYAKVNGTTTMSIANATATAVTWPAEIEDTVLMHSIASNTERVVVPVTGLYDIRSLITFASNATGYRQTQIFKNGSAFGTPIARNAVNGTVTPIESLERLSLTAGDYVDLRVTQNSTAALNIDQTQSWLAVELVRES